MSYMKCIANALNEGKMTSDIADAQKMEFERNFKKYKDLGMNEFEAERAAAKDTYDQLKIDNVNKKANVLKQARVNAQIDFTLKNYKNVKGVPDLIEAARSMLDQDAANNILSVTNLRRLELGLVHSPIASFMEKFRTGYFGRRDKFQKMTLPLVVKEILEPGSTGNKIAKEFAKAINESIETARIRHNQVGGNIAKIKGNYLPQPHNSVKVGAVSADEWIEYIIPRLDLQKMINNKTGRSFTKGELLIELPSVYEAIKTHGVSRIKPGKMPQSFSGRWKRLDHRFLVFKDADSYLTYQSKFGDDDVISTLYQHLESLSRDTAIMRNFGPNPDSGMAYMKQSIIKLTEKISTKEQLKIRGGWESVENLFLSHTGRLNSAVNKWWANMFAGLRHMLTSDVIGSATLLAQSDFFFTRTTSKFLGLPAYKANRRTLTLLKEGMKKDKTFSKIAIRSGFIADHWSTIASAANRYFIDTDAPLLAKMFSDMTLRASGLSHLTQAGRWSFGMEFLGFLGDNFNKSWKQLDEAFGEGAFEKIGIKLYGRTFRETLETYGIREGDWDIIRKTKLYDGAIDDLNIKPGQALLFKPADLLKRTDITPEYAELLNARVMEMILTETDHAIPTASLRGREVVMGRNKPGTFSYELLASGLMFKNFAIAIGFTHIMRGLRETGLTGKAGYLVPFLIGTTLMNAYSHEMREVLKGRDLINFKNLSYEQQYQYWLARLIAGGGLGIFGDLVYSEAEGESFGTDITDALLGLPVAFLKDTFGLGMELGRYLPGGKEPNLGRSFAQYIKKYTPGSSLWYLRAAWERIIIDTLQQLIDPKFHKRNQNTIKRYQKKEGRDYWWYPGDKAPIESPTISQ